MTETMYVTQCPDHPKYKAINAPRATEKNPQGCRTCWTLYELKHEESIEKDDEVVGS